MADQTTSPSNPTPDQNPDFGDVDESRVARIDIATSRVAAAIIGAEIKQCYRNAVMTFVIVDSVTLGVGDGDREDLRYVEGWVILDIGIPIEHGWLERRDGSVIDPTLVLTRDDDDDGNGELLAQRYVAAKRYSYEDVTTRAIARGETLPLLTAHGYGVVGESWYRAAYARAHRDLLTPDTSSDDEGVK